jgi:predicted lipoprotein with Yx(FWY)xxD motif
MNVTIRILSTGAVLAAALTACGATATNPGGVSGATATAAPATPTPVPATAPPSSAPAASAPVVMVGTTPAGMVLAAGSNGRTLYMFGSDVAGSGRSNCNAGCIGEWPALTVAAGASPTAGPGVTGHLGTIVRGDGSTQVTYNGLPLYVFSGDSAAGQTNGDYPGWKHAAP